MTLLGAAAVDQVPKILGMGAVTNLLVHAMPVLAEELTITAQKLIKNDLFGLEKYVLWGTDIPTTMITRASQRASLIGDPMADDTDAATADLDQLAHALGAAHTRVPRGM